MSTLRMTRRAMLKAGAAALPLAALPQTVLQAKEESKKPLSLTLGIATTGFTDRTNAELAAELKAAGIRTAQFFLTQKDSKYWRYNNRSDLSTLKPEKLREIAETYRAAGITLHSIGVYPNLIHPDPEERKQTLAFFGEMMKVGQQMGVRRFVTESGHYHPTEPIKGGNFDLRADVWKAMIATGKELAALAESYDATVLFEASCRSFLASAKRTRLFLEEIGSPRLRSLLDAANLLEFNDLEEMFDQLGPRIDCFHAKDYKLHAEHGVAPGLGDVDYVKYVRLAAQRRPGVPMIIEYVGSKNYQQALAHLRNALREAGVAEA